REDALDDDDLLETLDAVALRFEDLGHASLTEALEQSITSERRVHVPKPGRTLAHQRAIHTGFVNPIGWMGMKGRTSSSGRSPRATTTIQRAPAGRSSESDSSRRTTSRLDGMLFL